MPVPTKRLALAVVSLGLLSMLLPNSWVVVWPVVGVVVLAAAAFVFDWVRTPKPDLVEVDRDFPQVMTVGVPGTVSWRVANPAGYRTRIAVADELAPSLGAGDRRFEAVLEPHGVATATTRVEPSRRGKFAVTNLTVRVEGPLGLAARQSTRKMPRLLRVHPAFASKADAELRIESAKVLEVGLRTARGRGGGTDFEALRDYTTDDQFRRIDWAATARALKPVVRTYRAEKNQTVMVLLDNGRVMAGNVGGVPRVEHGMDAVMMLTAVATRLGDKAGLVTFDRQVVDVIAPARNTSQLARVTEAMYDLEPQFAESNYRAAFKQVVGRFRRRMLLVILTDLVEQVVGETLLPALPIISQGHLVIVGAVRDPQVVEWAGSGTDALENAHRRAAAVQALAQRERSIARLRAQGAVVIDAEPGELSQALADAYLTMKARGRL
jgi:uncharacterized protein (DUF58 family)